MERSRHLIVVDDHPLLQAGLVRQLTRAGTVAEPAELRPRDELVAWIIGRGPDGVVLDLGLPYEGGGLGLVEPIVVAGITVVVLTGTEDPQLWADCLAAGAAVVLAKSEPMVDVVDAVRRACAGEAVRPQQRATLAAESRRRAQAQQERVGVFDALSPREREVLAGLMEGHGPPELAARHVVSIKTVRTQVQSVLRKLGVRSQLEAVACAHRAGWTLDELVDVSAARR